MKKYFRDIWQAFYTIAVGMKITFRQLFARAVTIQYPEVKPKLTDRARNRLYVNMDDCIGCDQCSKACPVNCIEIDTVKSVPGDEIGTTSTGHVKRLWVTRFDIDIAKCCYCGLCVYPCPTECIKMTDVYEFSEFDRYHLVYNYSIMTPAEIETVQQKYEKWEADKAAQKAAAAKKKDAAEKPKETQASSDTSTEEGKKSDDKSQES